MKMSFCASLLGFFPLSSEFEELRTTYISNCVFNTFFSYTAIMLNLVTIQGIRKTSSLPKTLKTLLLSLAVSDVGVGLFVQPFYTSLLVRWLQQNDPGCITYTAFLFIWALFSKASFYGVVAISIDRFLAIHFHLRYQELVTHKRVVAVVVAVWMLAIFYSLMWLWSPPDIQFFILVITGAIGVLLTTIVYIRIYFAVRRHKIQIQSLQLQQAGHPGEIRKFAGVMKSAVGAFYVYLVFLICCLPGFTCLILTSANGSSIPSKKLFPFSFSILFLNSSLNPLIYCWKMRQIQHAIVDILHNILVWYRNRGTH